MQAIVLAGGLGTRLSGVISDVPKSMASIDGRPYLYHLLTYLSEQGITKVVLAVGYKAEVIAEYIGDSFKGMSIGYSHEKELLGTGGAIKKAFELVHDDEAFVFNGDIFFNVDLFKMKYVQKCNSANITIAVKKMTELNRYGSIRFDQNGKILSFEEKKDSSEGYINGGVYLIKKKYLCKIDQDKFSIEKEVFEKRAMTDNFFTFISNEDFVDIGIPEDYEKAKSWFQA